MKAVFVLLSLFSVQALACPDFTGSYFCQNEEGGDEGSYHMTMTQRPTTGGMIYTSTVDGESEDLIVDGRQHAVDSEQPQITYVANCAGKKVVAFYSGPLEESGEVIGKAEANVDYFLRGADLITHGKTVIIYRGQRHEQEQESACKRL